MKKSLTGLWKIMRYLRDDEIAFSNKLLFFVPIAYLLFPFDLIGDFFPLAGQLDDVAVFVVMWPILKNLLSGYGDSGDKKGRQSKGKVIDITNKKK